MAKKQVCLWPVKKDDKETRLTDCGAGPTTKIVTIDQGTPQQKRIPVCQQHYAEHNRRYAQKRIRTTTT